MVLESQSKELLNAKKLMREGKYEESFSIIKDFEEKTGISDEDKLSALILKGRLYTYIGKINEAVKVGELTYNLSQELGSMSGAIEALLLKSTMVLLGNLDKALDIILEAENLIDSLEKKTSSEYPRERATNLFWKSYVYYYKTDYTKALESALLSLSYRERLGKKMGIASTYLLIGWIYYGKGEFDPALDFGTKSLGVQTEIRNSTGIASSLTLIAVIHYFKGEIDLALQFCNQALGLKEIGNVEKFITYSYMGIIYRVKGELDRALKYHEQALSLTEVMNYQHPNVALNWVNIGNIYRMKGDYDKAIEFLKRLNFESTDQSNYRFYWRQSLFWLVLINLEKDFHDESQLYLSQLKELSDETKLEIYTQTYQLARAIVLKASGRTRNRYEAENLLMQIAEREIIEPEMYILSLVSLCEFLLEELENSNDLEVISEINPVITRLLEIAEEQHSYSILAETNLLQGRMALLTLNLNDARQYLTTAQKIADDHGLTLLAQKISYEHDNLLEELETWQSLKKKKTSISKRMKLAGVDGVMERMLGKRAVDPPAIVEEQPILLLIMDKSGNTFFNHTFAKDWDYNDLFSSFMSAFNTFSSEIFSKSIDRIKIDENLILINPIEPFLICYVIKGQSYSALKKLNSFGEVIKNRSEIWDSLQKSIKTSEMLDLNNPPSLGAAINEIFSS
ncbi:MAG: tetratricopeptide repeat protein [Promethearchaeota archaeon]|jgi:tetratricopeptide (TPR) repeat protein